MVLTTPDGAHVPATAHEEGFPLLVRLNREFFDFSQASADGSDLRFSADNQPLPYQIDHWDAVKGEAAVWVRFPVIRGNARQEFSVHWGKVGVASESSGKAVFNESNGFAAVMHLGDAAEAITDEVGVLAPTNVGTASCNGIIGLARRFDIGKGVACGEQILGLPTGAGPCTTEAWVKADRVNGVVVGWGNEQAQGKVVMQVRSPPKIRMDCYFSNADVASVGRLPLAQWVLVSHVYREGESKIYVNGTLDGVTKAHDSPLNVHKPARMWLGGWYNNYDFAGAMDEVRISKVARSADWIKLVYENQKPWQTLVGTPPQAGTAFAVAPSEISLEEGQSVVVTAQAGGAEKVYWILRRGNDETVVATDRFSFTLNAGRVAHDTAYVLRFKAVYRDEVKIRDIPVKVKDAIPEPLYELAGPKQWDGRETVEIVPQIKNLEAMKAAGAGELHYRWTVSGGAVIKQIATDRLLLHRSQYSGPIQVHAWIDNGGAAVEQSIDIAVTEPKADRWNERSPEKNEKPEEGQFYARGDNNEGTLYYNGVLDQRAESVFLHVYADEKPFAKLTSPLTDDKGYAFTVKLKPGLVKYRVEFGIKKGDAEQVLDSVTNLVCGDAFLIDGQSNALATDTQEVAPPVSSEWIRSYGGPTGRGDDGDWIRERQKAAERAGLARPNLWCTPVWKATGSEHTAELGWWGMELAKRLVASQQMPIFIINAAVGGSRIDEHQPSPDHADLKTMYGRMLWRVKQARMTHGIRAIIWHQGENDQGADGPTGGYGWETYQQYFIDLTSAWKQDLPNVRRYYVFQIWPNACAMGGELGSGDKLREVQRTLPRLFSNMSIMSTVGIKPPGGCHFPLKGWGEFARLIEPLIERDVYGKAPAGPISPPNLLRARFLDTAKNAIVMEFDQSVVWRDCLATQIYLDDEAGRVISGQATGNALILKLKTTSTARKITYLKERRWDPDCLLFGANGLAALTFSDVRIEDVATP